MATKNFELGQLLKAYRKGLISEELFEDQLHDINLGSNGSRQTFIYKGLGIDSAAQAFATEREMVMRLLDDFRCGENFASEYLTKWAEVADQECVKGGVRVVAAREKYHAQILEARLRELGGTPQCTVPMERRQKELAFHASTDMKDAEKLATKMGKYKDFRDITEALKVLTDAIDQIEEDQQSKELLRSLIDDEMSSGKWLLGAHQLLNGIQTGSQASTVA